MLLAVEAGRAIRDHASYAFLQVLALRNHAAERRGKRGNRYK
jgi:hypothetical protein